jgi:hypothetical protein
VTVLPQMSEDEMAEQIKELSKKIEQDARRVPRDVPIAPYFQVKDSGQRQEFDSGMVRDTDEGKIDYARIFDGPMADRWAEHLTKGAKKYPDDPGGTPNWMKATGQAELIRAKKSAVRHFRQWLRGDLDEDHAAAVFFNINEVEYIRER